MRNSGSRNRIKLTIIILSSIILVICLSYFIQGWFVSAAPYVVTPPAGAINQPAVTETPEPSTSTITSPGKIYTVNPGQSIQNVLDKMVKGDICIVNAGIYYESLKISASGLTIRGNGAPVIDAQFNSDIAIDVTGNHNTIEGLVIENSKGPVVRFNGINSQYNTIEQCDIYGWQLIAPDIPNTTNEYPYAMAGGINIDNSASHITIANNYFYRGNVLSLLDQDTKAISFCTPSWGDKSYGGFNKIVNNVIEGRSLDSNGRPVLVQLDFGDGYPLYKLNIYDGISGSSQNRHDFNNTLIQGNHIYGARDDAIEPQCNDINLVIDRNYIDCSGGMMGVVLRDADIGPIQIDNNIIVNFGDAAFKYGSTDGLSGNAVKHIDNNIFYSTLGRTYNPYPTYEVNKNSYSRIIDGEVNGNDYDNLNMDNNQSYSNSYFVALMSGSGTNNTFTNNKFSTDKQSSCVKWFGNPISFKNFNSITGGTNVWKVISRPSEPEPPEVGPTGPQ